MIGRSESLSWLLPVIQNDAAIPSVLPPHNLTELLVQALQQPGAQSVLPVLVQVLSAHLQQVPSLSSKGNGKAVLPLFFRLLRGTSRDRSTATRQTRP